MVSSKVPKKLSKGKMKQLKDDVLTTVAECHQILPDLLENKPDFEGAYAYIEDYMRDIVDTLQQFEEYDEENCVVWGALAGEVLDFLDTASKEYQSLKAQNKIPPKLLGVYETMESNRNDINAISKKTNCQIKRLPK